MPCTADALHRFQPLSASAAQTRLPAQCTSHSHLSVRIVTLQPSVELLRISRQIHPLKSTHARLNWALPAAFWALPHSSHLTLRLSHQLVIKPTSLGFSLFISPVPVATPAAQDLTRLSFVKGALAQARSPAVRYHVLGNEKGQVCHYFFTLMLTLTLMLLLVAFSISSLPSFILDSPATGYTRKNPMSCHGQRNTSAQRRTCPLAQAQ